jgi:hypothetical protein
MSHTILATAAVSAPAAVNAAAAKTPFIDWAALGKVAGASFVFGVAIVVLFSIGIVGLSWMRGGIGSDDEPATLASIDGGASAVHGAASGGRTLGAGLAGLCFAICAAAVLYGLWIIIPQFHR